MMGWIILIYLPVILFLILAIKFTINKIRLMQLTKEDNKEGNKGFIAFNYEIVTEETNKRKTLKENTINKLTKENKTIIIASSILFVYLAFTINASI